MKLAILFFLSGLAVLSGRSHLQLETYTKDLQEPPRKKIVVLDTYFNNEWKKDSTGANTRYHYTWDDKKNSGFSKLGELFASHAALAKYLASAPTAKNLENSDIYIIVDPDTEKEAEKPNYMDPLAARIITSWVYAGGVLMLMGNDSGNTELKRFNLLASAFGIRFNEDRFNPVINNQYQQGAVMIPRDHHIFKTAKKIFVKELSTLQVRKPAETVLTKEGKNIMAVAKYGKGMVFVVGDPWLYNEYVDGKLPPDFDNYKAAEDLVEWLLSNTRE